MSTTPCSSAALTSARPLCVARGKRLFDQDVLAGLDRRHRHLEMTGWRDGNQDGLNRRIVEHGAQIVDGVDAVEGADHRARTGEIGIAHRSGG
jgi:hypothetical protein